MSVESESEEMRSLRWRCRRGVLELDLILLRFLNTGYQELMEDEKEVFRELLDLQDAVLLNWIQGTQNPPDTMIKLIKKIQ